ncbi:tetratricopeptide repeat protein [Polynucleobacter paneuropaeus]|nr:tetratricopeptide repeat protein [Polynucleobacter paneuropaeus]
MRQIIQNIQSQIDLGRLPIARVMINAALQEDPSNYRLNELSAFLFLMQDQRFEGIKLLKKLSKLPNCTDIALYELGSALMQSNDYDGAREALEKAFKISSGVFEIAHDLATVYAALGRSQEALVLYEKAAHINPDSSELLYNLGRLHDDLYREKEAIGFYQKAFELNPRFVEPLINIGTNLIVLEDDLDALRYFDKAFELDPDFPYLYGDRLYLQQKIGIWHNQQWQVQNLIQAIQDGKKAITPFHLLGLVDDPELAKKTAILYANDRYPINPVLGNLPKLANSEKIKIGYFSPDFRNHATAILTAEMFELHNRDRFEIIAFSVNKREKDVMKSRLMKSFDQFIECAHLNDIDVAKLAREMGIDIAVDLGGITQDARMGIFAARAAPVQVNYLVYPGTLGSNYHDYLLADQVVIPEYLQHCYTEKIAYLPNCYQVNDRKREVSEKVFDRQHEGLPKETFVFCCFNNNYKISPEIFSVWMQLLKELPNAVLWLLEANEVAKENLLIEAKKLGITSDRIIFAKKTKKEDHLGRQRLADLFLDTFPYGAHTTASDALWVGLPLITLIGKSFQSRVAASLLESVGHPELITHDLEGYKDLAIHLAKNPDQLRSIRADLSDKQLMLPLFDTPRFVKSIESAYQHMYENALEGKAPQTFHVLG